MKKIILIFLLCSVLFVLIAFIGGKINLSLIFSREINELFSQSKNISENKLSYNKLSSLPEPVKRYFMHVLKNGQPYISYIRLKHSGKFKPDLNKEFVSITGEQYYTTDPPGFIWKGTTSFFTARDMYISGKGKLVVSLFSLLKVVNGSGPDYDHGELLRWLGESVWFPTNLLPSERIAWTPIDSRTAGLIFKYNGVSLFYKVSFNERFEITELETKRSMGNNRYETWIGRAKDYKEINGVIIPSKIEAVWRLKNEDFTYAEFHIEEIEYGKKSRW